MACNAATAPATPSATLAASPAAPASQAAPATPHATSSLTAAASATATSKPMPTAVVPTLIPVADGEQWMTYEWYAEGQDYKSVFLARPDGDQVHLIATDVSGEHRGPAWSPTGDRIAFIVLNEVAPNGSIWLSAPDGSGAKPALDAPKLCPGGAYWPAWSPDGTKLSIVCYSLTDKSVAVLDLATGGVHLLTTVTTPEHFDNPASWSPDGSTIAFDDEHWDPTGAFLDGSRIGTIPSEGGKITWLTQYNTFAAWPDWHPTKDLISFNSYDLGNMQQVDHPSNLWTMRSDGSDVQQITNLTDPAKLRATQARWMPDGSSLIVSCASGNPVNDVMPCFVDPASGIVTYPVLIPSGARPDMRPIP